MTLEFELPFPELLLENKRKFYVIDKDVNTNKINYKRPAKDVTENAIMKYFIP